MPITLRDGSVYGTFCAFGYNPDSSLSDRDLAMMHVFADFVASEVDAELASARDLAEKAARVEAVLTGEGISIAFQPIVDLSSGAPIGYEALARFSARPVRSPDIWFNEAAGVGLGTELELAALRLALQHVDELPADTYMAVNASPAALVSSSLRDVLDGADPERIVIEVTEHAAIVAYEGLQAVLAGLRGRGFRVAVDDAGAGYATFRHILRLRPDFIKLDMTLTRDIDSDPARQALASALIAFGRATGSAIIAEGIETSSEMAQLRKLGVTRGQGFHLGRPLPLDQHLRSGTIQSCTA